MLALPRNSLEIGLVALVFASLAWLTGCSQSSDREPPSLLQALNASYELALRETQGSAYRFIADEPAEQAAIQRLQAFFTDMTPASARANAASVYAPNAYLNDTVVGIFGADVIGEYFAHAAAQAEVFNVEFLDVVRGDVDYYIRWQMTVRAEALSNGVPVVSYGTTQFRFDEQGRVLIHKDFWDAATGVYEHLPYFCRVMAYIHRKLAGDAAALSFSDMTQ